MIRVPDDLLGIPPALDLALARAVLADLHGARVVAVDATGADAGGQPAEQPAELPAALSATVASVVDALRDQGARASEVLLAVEDAFAALLAGQRDAAGRGRVLVLDSHARQLVAARLGYA